MPLPEVEVGRKRLTQVFRFLQALDQHRNPQKRQVDEQLWLLWLKDLPSHPSIQTNSGEFVLRVKRPTTTPCKPPPRSIESWLRAGWEDPFQRVEIIPSKNEPGEEGGLTTVRFEEDPNRQFLLAEWKKTRDEWCYSERPARQAMKVFETLYGLHGQMEREGERVELVLGDGILSWRRPEGGIYHPILLKRLELTFHPKVPEFLLSETDHPAELYSSLFQSMQDVDAKAIANCRDELESGGYHPLGDESTTGFLRGFVARLSSQGVLCEDGRPKGELDYPRIGRSAVLFLRSRTLGFPMALEQALEDIRSRDEFSTSLLQIVGIETDAKDGNRNEQASAGAIPAKDILFSKPANNEQREIVRRLQLTGNIVVQGPPGTGKTHTIANLIGHLLAHNMSVLVTSHTAKALRVLRSHLVPQLRPLCVNVLENDTGGREQLKASVETISQRVGSSDPNQLETKVSELELRRTKLLGELERARSTLLEARRDEYKDIVIGGQAWQPSNAARKVIQEKEQNNWIPSPVTLGASLPLSTDEFADLYRTNRDIPVEDETELSVPMPAPNQLMSPEEFDRLLDVTSQLARAQSKCRPDLWDHDRTTLAIDDLESLGRQVQEAITPLINSEPWKLTAITAGMGETENREPWDVLISKIKMVDQLSTDAQVALLKYAPTVPDTPSFREQLETCEEILRHLQNGGKLSRWVLLIRSSWKKFIENSRVATGSPRDSEHFLSLSFALRLKISRTELLGLWKRQMERLGALPSKEFRDQPEKVCQQFIPAIKDSLEWNEKIWNPIENHLRQMGLNWREVLKEQPPNPAANGHILRIRDGVTSSLLPIIEAQAAVLHGQLAEAKLGTLRNTLESFGSSNVLNKLRGAVADRDSVDYLASFRRLVHLHQQRDALQKRRTFLARLEQVAPSWAASIRAREGSHGLPTPPPNINAAWIWRQLTDELDRRQTLSFDDILKKIERLSNELRSVTADLIDYRAWASQVRRTTLPKRQALLGWLDTVRKRGFERGKRAHILQAQAARLMSKCKSAVPVWVMPLSRVVENFDLRTSRFDVVIIDEASQSDVMALLAFYMAKHVVVVGDHEQVSPTSFQDLTVVQNLIDQFLQGIPNAHLYDGTTSIYDLARQSFGGSVPLLEHFRCVPEIIQFSNHLSYSGRLSPLRDASRVETKPHVIAHRVKGGQSISKVNKEEAVVIASLIAALIEQPEYEKNEQSEDVSVGVISLVGEEQALEIDRLIRLAVSEEEYERRRILCGNSAQFQGDERDVMFLSVVDSAREGPLSLRQDQVFKQRFNVAASRARDQMWVVHSLNPSTDLKPADLRLRLIRHAEDPQALLRLLDKTESRVESELERRVARRLVEKGYRVTPQKKVGYYRIDLVVEAQGKCLAVECDGDRYHPLEKLAEDMERQAILERLGWKFVRIRGSQFFRDPDRAMAQVTERLDALGIQPEAIGTSQPSTPQQQSELKERIIRRAEEIRRSWEETTQAESDKPDEETRNVLPDRHRYSQTATQSRAADSRDAKSEDREASTQASFFQPRSTGNEREPSATFHPGTRVCHPRFGDGVVLAREGDGADAKLTIHFTRAGVKRISQGYSDLRSLTL